MPNAYRPEKPRPGVEQKTNERNMEQAYAILNRLANDIDKIRNDITNINISFGGGSGLIEECCEFALMTGGHW